MSEGMIFTGGNRQPRVVPGPLRFVHVGYGYTLCANRVVAVLPPEAAPTRKMIAFAKDNNIFLDMTRGNKTKSCLLMEDGSLVGLAFNPKTIHKRLNEDPLERSEKHAQTIRYYGPPVDDRDLDNEEDEDIDESDNTDE